MISLFVIKVIQFPKLIFSLKPYKILQKCQKPLANLGSEDTVVRPKNYQAKVPGTVSRTKRSANFSHPQVKHFLGCKKSTKSNTCGSLFTCSGALLFSSTKTAKFQNPCISGHGAFACILYHVSTQEIPETPQIFRPWQFVGWRQAQKNGKKWVSFNASFTPPCQFFRGFRLFRPFLIFIVGCRRGGTCCLRTNCRAS